MRGFVVVVASSLGLSACLFGSNGPRLDPELVVVSPATGTEIVDHAPVTLEIQVFDVRLDRLELAVDGATVSPGSFTLVPQPTGELCAPCNVTVVWNAIDVREGSHVVSVNAFAGNGLKAVGTLALAFDDTPEILSIAPADDEDLLGVGEYTVRVAVVERGEATLDLAIDGVEVDSVSSNECHSAAGCSLSFVWDTTTFAAGPHELHAVVTDKNGNMVEDTRTVVLDDLVKVTSMELANTTDESGTLEIEIYVFDNVTNAFLGCAGTVAGLGPVDASGIRYAVDAQLVDTTGAPLHAQDLTAHAVRFEVWEDDDNPVCPSVLDPNGNDLVGASPAKSLAQWKATPTTTFGNVTELAVQIGRPLSR